MGRFPIPIAEEGERERQCRVQYRRSQGPTSSTEHRAQEAGNAITCSGAAAALHAAGALELELELVFLVRAHLLIAYFFEHMADGVGPG
jgi:hypothetical protein